MLGLNTLLSERQAVAAVLDSASVSVGTALSSALDMTKYQRAQFIVAVGAIGSSGTVDVKLQQATTSGGTYKDITGKAITQIAASNKQAVINLRGEELDIANGYGFVKALVTVGTAASVVGVIGLGGDPRQDVASANDVASVVEIVA